MHQDFAALAQFRDILVVDAFLLLGLIEMPTTDQLCRLPVEFLVAAFSFVFVVLTCPILFHYITALRGKNCPAEAERVKSLDVVAVLVCKVADQVSSRWLGTQLAAEVAEIAAKLISCKLVRALGTRGLVVLLLVLA